MVDSRFQTSHDPSKSGFDPSRTQCFYSHLNQRNIPIYAIRFGGQIEFDVGVRPHVTGCNREGILDVLAESHALVLVKAPHFCLNSHLRWDAVANRTTLDCPDVHGSLRIDSSYVDYLDCTPGRLDGRDSFLRLHPGVSGPSRNLDVNVHNGWATHNNGVNGIHVQEEASPRVEQRVVQVLYSEEARLFLSSDHKLKGRMPLRGEHGFQELGDASLAVSSQDRLPFRGDDPIAHHRLNPYPGFH